MHLHDGAPTWGVGAPWSAALSVWVWRVAGGPALESAHRAVPSPRVCLRPSRDRRGKRLRQLDPSRTGGPSVNTAPPCATRGPGRTGRRLAHRQGRRRLLHNASRTLLSCTPNTVQDGVLLQEEDVMLALHSEAVPPLCHLSACSRRQQKYQTDVSDKYRRISLDFSLGRFLTPTRRKKSPFF